MAVSWPVSVFCFSCPRSGHGGGATVAEGQAIRGLPLGHVMFFLSGLLHQVHRKGAVREAGCADTCLSGCGAEDAEQSSRETVWSRTQCNVSSLRRYAISGGSRDGVLV